MAAITEVFRELEEFVPEDRAELLKNESYYEDNEPYSDMCYDSDTDSIDTAPFEDNSFEDESIEIRNELKMAIKCNEFDKVHEIITAKKVSLTKNNFDMLKLAIRWNCNRIVRYFCRKLGKIDFSEDVIKKTHFIEELLDNLAQLKTIRMVHKLFSMPYLFSSRTTLIELIKFIPSEVTKNELTEKDEKYLNQLIEMSSHLGNDDLSDAIKFAAEDIHNDKLFKLLAQLHLKYSTSIDSDIVMLKNYIRDHFEDSADLHEFIDNFHV